MVTVLNPFVSTNVTFMAKKTGFNKAIKRTEMPGHKINPVNLMAGES